MENDIAGFKRRDYGKIVYGLIVGSLTIIIIITALFYHFNIWGWDSKGVSKEKISLHIYSNCSSAVTLNITINGEVIFDENIQYGYDAWLYPDSYLYNGEATIIAKVDTFELTETVTDKTISVFVSNFCNPYIWY